MSSQLQESRCFKKRIRKLEDANKKLALELEHEKGKLAGLAQSHNTLREHSNILETALAKREADLVQLNLQVGEEFVSRNNDQSVIKRAPSINASITVINSSTEVIKVYN